MTKNCKASSHYSKNVSDGTIPPFANLVTALANVLMLRFAAAAAVVETRSTPVGVCRSAPPSGFFY